MSSGPGTSPSQRYLTGFLVPSEEQPTIPLQAEADEDVGVVPENPPPDEQASDSKAPKRRFFPASIGLSFQVDRRTQELEVTVSWGDYNRETVDGGWIWQRTPREECVLVAVPPEDDPNDDIPLPGSDGLTLHVVARSVHLPSGAQFKTVSIFLVNRRPPSSGESPEERDPTYVFQPEIRVESDLPLPRRSIAQSTTSGDLDDQIAALHYADVPAYATGHGVSVDWEVVNGQCHNVSTAWIPEAAVPHSRTSSQKELVLSMNQLAKVRDGSEAASVLKPLVDEYRSWIDNQALAEDAEIDHSETAEHLLTNARHAAKRMERGIECLSADDDLLDAFRVANRAVAHSLRQRLQIDDPAWRPFQLAFILLNLTGIANPRDPERGFVDLLFFPTGGGKTEAYLGLAAIAMVLRRIRHPGDGGRAGAGTCVIMRYTLRLLTLDQLNRAAGVVCALELERRNNPDTYGKWPFEIGLWVGMAATPNRMGGKDDSRRGSARKKVHSYKENPAGNPAPLPLGACPWCGEEFDEYSYELLPTDAKPKRLQLTCKELDCEFSEPPGVPVVAVDESVYRRLPAFLIATVDKFAALPWTGESGLLLGGADRFDGEGFYGPCDQHRGNLLSSPLLPPDLVIQDELHLISGPLGTMVGLYETAIDALGSRNSPDRDVRPKIVASTATIRRARDQVQSLFARTQTMVFPPLGPDRRDSFFARTIENPNQARLYLGISAQGRNAKSMMRRVWVALMGAAFKAYCNAGGDDLKSNPADPYMSLVGYFNSLRELGGGRRILEEEVRSGIRRIGARRRMDDEGLFRDRRRFTEVLELTSRVSTDQVAKARRQLENPYRIKFTGTRSKGSMAVDAVIATNMISVGLDIQRLGLMTVIGQPKTISEYIQSTSRVGRDTDRPGLVITLFNVYRPRDRSHYERFKHVHETLYRSVEVTSVTPFSARALDKGLAGALVALARHAVPAMTSWDRASRIDSAKTQLESILEDAFLQRVDHQRSSKDDAADQRQDVRERIEGLLDSWVKLRDGATTSLRYQKYEGKKGADPLLIGMLDSATNDDQRKFRAGRSLRDVEPEVTLRLLP